MAIDTEALKATTQSFVSAYNSWDLEALMSESWRSPSCISQILPLSLERLPMNNEEWKKWFGPRMKAMSNFHIKVKEMIVDEKERKVVIWASSTGETIIGPYKNEYVFILECGKDGRVEWIREFVDSKYTSDFFAKLENYKSEEQTKSS
ncbi:hypothetical protein D9758_014475 [Tetrapyrgos nigripes]|uniref:SnoaL-like domain-containing protein n=1 Tax=Tetrapyrgos nigripes TaxID=182062 RepID=A0A8H5C8W9_9AGAR|nr:hypothetical protein D9758_014475 [Tetrapyrgos nigripes]